MRTPPRSGGASWPASKTAESAYARASREVAPATVFTHFASKEDIFFGRGSEFDAALPEWR
ncbi:hypothetical protein [Streptomyces syringium]|uniref:hypothetical protein n=1 Tax=Streptomyces syringium TaxID=76729 RepID=UPI003427194A